LIIYIIKVITTHGFRITRDDQGKKSTTYTYANILEQPSIKNIIEKDNDKTKQIPGFNISFIIIAILIFLLKKNRILKKY